LIFIKRQKKVLSISRFGQSFYFIEISIEYVNFFEALLMMKIPLKVTHLVLRVKVNETKTIFAL
jgi:hypothetical protein